ncbi:MAG: Uma2 family endonuclease [Candidatus Solibacter sp.]
MATQPKTHLTPEQYLEIERKAESKSEYYNGEMFAMSGARESHNLIVTNLAIELGLQLRKRPCKAYFVDMRVHIPATGLYTYPDASALCGEPLFLDETRDTLINPSLIVEVLFPSTEAFDRGGKFKQYRSIEPLSEYVLAASDEVSVELYTRQGDGKWLLTTATKREDVIELQSIGARVTLADLYDKVEFAEPRR